MRKENKILASAVLAPLLLISYFVIAKIVKAEKIEPPKYDFIFSIRKQGNAKFPNKIHDYEFKVINGKLSVIALKESIKPDYSDADYGDWDLLLFRYDVKANKAIQINFESHKLLNKIDTDKEEWLVDVPGLQKLTISKSSSAPDDYQFHYGMLRHDLGIFNFVRQQNEDFWLTKEDKNIKLNFKFEPGDQKSWNWPGFVGWVLTDD